MSGSKFGVCGLKPALRDPWSAPSRGIEGVNGTYRLLPDASVPELM